MLEEDDVSASDHSVGMVENSQFIIDDYTGGSTSTYAAPHTMEKKEKAKV